MELGIYSFGNSQRNPDGTLRPTAEAVTDLVESICLADESGLDYFGVGEHHSLSMPVSSPITLLAAAAAVTTKIKLGTTVTVLSTDDPVRVYQQAATAWAISGGRFDLTAGRGSSPAPFPLFGYDLADYDQLYAEKLGLLLEINAHERVTWAGSTRASLRDALIVPRVESGLKIWLGTGGSPSSTVRAGQLGLPVSYGAIGGTTDQWGALSRLYRETARAAGHDPATLDIAVATHGFVMSDGAKAREQFYRYEQQAFATFANEHRQPPHRRDRASFHAEAAAGGMIFAGEPNEIADRLIALHRQIGHSRHLIQMDLGQMPKREVLASIELFATAVAPQVRKELGD
jgi:alkanesulfonate monooxygenase SsuD/methylene tetrahydromethanopterin reductase-like flavin-dependent oxidoreductase (luciferase family)